MADRQGWEQKLSRSLGDQASRVPGARRDLASAAIGRARRVQRRRTLAGFAAVVAATVLATGVWAHTWPEPTGSELGAVSGLFGERESTSPTPQPEDSARLAHDEGIATDLATEVVGPGATGGLVLSAPDGVVVELPGVRQVRSVVRSGDGWAMVGGDPGRERLWWVGPQQSPVTLLAGVDTVLMDGNRVVSQRGSLLSASMLIGGELIGRASTTGPADGRAMALVHDTVLLQRTTGPGWGLWHPGTGDYEPAWNTEIAEVFGPLPDGASAVGLVPADSGADQQCLARLDLGDRLRVMETRCLPRELVGDLDEGAPAVVSPQGRWLLAAGASVPVLVDLAAVFDDPEQSALVLAGVPQPGVAPMWLSSDRALVNAGDRLLEVRPSQVTTGDDAVPIGQYPLAGPAPIVATG